MIVALNEKYSLEPSDFRCMQCSSEVKVDATFYSAVFFEKETFQRRSFCVSCWDPAGKVTEEVFAFWRSRRQPPDAPARKLRFDPDLVLEFFRRLGAAGEPEKEPQAHPGEAPTGENPSMAKGERARLRLVLALLLLRRKYLIYESSAMREGREWLKLSEKADPQKVHLVENPSLSDEQLETVKASLGVLLQMDFG